MEIVAISIRQLLAARAAHADCDERNVEHVGQTPELYACIARGDRAITDDPMLLCECEGIDVVVEVTSTIEFAAHVVMSAMAGYDDVELPPGRLCNEFR